MSINDFFNKIKGQIGIDSTTYLCLLVVVLVGLSSFGIGRLSVLNNNDNSIPLLQNKELGLVKEEIGKNADIKYISDENTDLIKQKMYVASKNGKLYYRTTCSGANRIAVKNQVWFASREDAEKSGYTLSSSCK